MTATEFSLVTETWIPVVLADETRQDVSLRQVFDGSLDIRSLECDSPSQEYAVLRVLIAMFVRAHVLEGEWDLEDLDDIDEWRREVWADVRNNAPDEAALTYLNRFAHRFDLLHDTEPFMQVAGMHTKEGKVQPATRLIPEAEDAYFSMRAGAGAETLDFAEAARWLVHLHAFDYAGIKPGVVGDPREKGGKSYPTGTGWAGYTGGTTILGTSLRETILMNVPDTIILASDGDKPAWEREQDTPGPRTIPTPQGACDLMTWQSRRVILHHDDTRVTGCLVTNGDKIPDAGANVLDDPMTPYRFSTNKSKKDLDVYYPAPYNPERTVWRSLVPLVALSGDVELTAKAKAGKRPASLEWIVQARDRFDEIPTVVPVRLTSVEYGPQASTIVNTVDATLDLPTATLQPSHTYARRTLLAAAHAADSAGGALGRFAGQLLQAAGGDYEYRGTATESFLAGQEQHFRSWLRDLPTTDTAAIDEALAAWHTHLHQAALERADTLIRGAGPRALIGRTVMNGDREETYSAANALGHLKRKLTEVLPHAQRPALTSTPPTNPTTAHPPQEATHGE